MSDYFNNKFVELKQELLLLKIQVCEFRLDEINSNIELNKHLDYYGLRRLDGTVKDPVDVRDVI